MNGSRNRSEAGVVDTVRSAATAAQARDISAFLALCPQARRRARPDVQEARDARRLHRSRVHVYHPQHGARPWYARTVASLTQIKLIFRVTGTRTRKKGAVEVFERLWENANALTLAPPPTAASGGNAKTAIGARNSAMESTEHSYDPRVAEVDEFGPLRCNRLVGESST